MKKPACSISFVILLLLQPAILFSQENEEPIRAFPGAEGFGAYSKGGRGGKVYHVTTLADSGPGSLREAVGAEGPRIIVFDISGTIKLEKVLVVGNSYITIAGQTAPGDGICLRDGTLFIRTDHVVIRYLRCRLGDQGETGDAVTIAMGRNIIIDHCSTSWGLDEILSSSTHRPVINDLTVQWCFITEALNPKDHGFGSLIRGCRGVHYSYHHNLYAHNQGRNPRPGNYDISNPHDKDPNGLLLDFRNNVIYNWGGSHAGYNADKDTVTKLNYVGNYLVPGADSKAVGIAYKEGSPYNRGYFAGNYYNHKLSDDQWKLVNFGDWNASQIVAYKQSESFESGAIVTQDAKEAYRDVLEHGGASLPRRDAADKRIVEQVKNGGGHIIDSQKEVGGWPELKSAPAPADSDGDGMPDDWEKQHGLNPMDKTDGAEDANDDGYTNVEEYLNSLVKT